MKKSKIPFALTAITSLTAFSIATSTLAQETEPTDAGCSYNTTTPIIPDGNIATKDELVSAQKRVKVYQESLLDFRECLLEKEKMLDPSSESYEDQKAALAARSNKSIDLESKVAAEFNDAIKIYKTR